MSNASTTNPNLSSEGGGPLMTTNSTQTTTPLSPMGIQQYAQRYFQREGQSTASNSSSTNQVASLMSSAADSSVNFNPISAGIRAFGDIGSAVVGGTFGLINASQDRALSKEMWQKDWQAADQMGLYSPSQIGSAAGGYPSQSDTYKLGYRGLSRQPRTKPGSPFSM